MADNKLNEIIGTALEKMQSISDGNTVIGKPIETPSGTTIIPVSKVSLGLVSGGVDYFAGSIGSGAPNEREAYQWIHAVIDDKDPCVLPEQAYCVTQILDGIYESAKTGNIVFLNK